MKPLPKAIIQLIFFFTILSIPLFTISAQNESAGQVRRIALFVGANNGGMERQRLLWAIDDARKMGDVMTELGGMKKEDFIVLEDPSPKTLLEAMSRAGKEVSLLKNQARRVEFIFYYSGHSNETGLLIGSQQLRYDILRKAINDVKADVSIAILDSCASGAFTRQKGGMRVLPFLVDESNDMKGYAFLTSASENESAQESDHLGASFFTHYMISALRGAADANGDGKVTLNEAYNYAFTETLNRTQGTQYGAQHASYDIQLQGSGDLVLSDLSQPTARIILDEKLEGTIYIRNQKNQLVMEIRKTSAKQLNIALQPGFYKLRIENSAGVFEAQAKLVFLQTSKISMADLNKTAIIATRQRGDESVESLPEANGISFWQQIEDTIAASIAQAQSALGEATSGLSVTGAFQLSFTPGLSTVPNEVNSQSFLSLSPLLSLIGSNEGTMLAGLGNINLGSQIGYQGAGLFNLSKSLNGAQTAGLFNINDEAGFGVQAAGLFNITGAGLEGVQAAGLFNINPEGGLGVQAAGLFNISGARFEGVQAAGLFNLADKMTGLMLAPINIANSIEGVPIGLVNIIADGIHDISLLHTFDDRFWLSFVNGSKNFYSSVEIGTDSRDIFETMDGLAFGINWGARLTEDIFFADLSAGIKHFAKGTDSATRLASLFNWQAGGSAQLVPHFRLIAGIDIGWGIAYLGLQLDQFLPALANAQDYYDNESQLSKNQLVLAGGGSVVLVPLVGISFSF